MSDNPPKTHRELYLEAAAHIDAGGWDECIAAARENIGDPSITRYLHMKNLILIADATDDWYLSERCRGEIEHMWNVTDRMTAPDDEVGQRALRDVRSTLDKLTRELEELKPEDFDPDLIYPESDEEMEEGGEDAMEAAPRRKYVFYTSFSPEAERVSEASVAAAIAKAEQERADPNHVGPHSGMPVVDDAPWYRAPEAAPVTPTPAPEPSSDPAPPPVFSDPPEIQTTSPATSPQTSPKGQTRTPGRYSTLPSRSRGFMAATSASKARSRSTEGRGRK